MLTTQIYNRDLFEPGHKITGPAIVEQLDTTTVIQPEQEATVDEYRNIIIREKTMNCLDKWNLGTIGTTGTKCHSSSITFHIVPARSNRSLR